MHKTRYSIVQATVKEYFDTPVVNSERLFQKEACVTENFLTLYSFYSQDEALKKFKNYRSDCTIKKSNDGRYRADEHLVMIYEAEVDEDGDEISMPTVKVAPFKQSEYSCIN